MLSDGKDRLEMTEMRSYYLQKKKKKDTHTHETKYGMNQMKKAWEEYNLSKRPGGESLEHYEGCLEEAFHECQGRRSAMVRVVLIIVMVGVKAAVVAGPGVPGSCLSLPLEFSLPTWSDDENKKTNKEPKKRKSNWTAQIKSNNNNKKNEGCCTKKKEKNWLCSFSQWSAKPMINTRDGNFSSSQQ